MLPSVSVFTSFSSVRPVVRVVAGRRRKWFAIEHAVAEGSEPQSVRCVEADNN